MSLDKMCCVPNCGSTREDNAILHSFPDPNKQPDRFRSWIYAIGGDILALDNNKIYRYRKVCHKHFVEKFHTYTRRLSAGAVPTVNLPGFGSTKHARLDSHSTTLNPSPSVQASSSKGSSVREPFKKLTNLILPDVTLLNPPPAEQPKPTTTDKPRRRKPLVNIYSSEASLLTKQLKRVKKREKTDCNELDIVQIMAKQNFERNKK